MPTVILVCGSRSLAKKKGAHDWCRGLLFHTFADLTEADSVLSGGALGPDTWCKEVALDMPGHYPTFVEYHPSGQRFEDRYVPATQSYRAKPGWWSRDVTRDPRVAPLVRDQAMVDGVKRAVDAGWKGLVVGFIDDQSMTHGTKYTLRLAREAGLEVVRYVFPKKGEQVRLPQGNEK